MKYLLTIKRPDGSFRGGIYTFDEAIMRYRFALHDTLAGSIEIKCIDMERTK